MRLSNTHLKKKAIKSKSKKKYVLIDDRNPRLKSEGPSYSNERFNTVGDIRNNSINKKKNSKKKGKESYFRNLSRKKELILKIKINPEKNDKESYPYNLIQQRINKSKDNNKKLKDYPNNIKGVLGQAIYNNQTNNVNYSENVRYKPITDVFNEQSNITTRKITTDNNASLNLSFNSKSDLFKKEKEKNDIDNNINNYNIENEIKINGDSIKTRKYDTLIKSGKIISPILSNSNYNENKKEINNNAIVSEYINKSIDKNDKRNKNYINIINNEFNNVEIHRIKIALKKEELKIEKNNEINILQNISNKYKDFIIFKNEEEIWKFIKNKMSEEKEKEYYNNKMKYNYFTLIKKFHGKILYEIDLENNIDEINYIFEKENVKIENEPIKLIKKSSDKIDIDNSLYKEINELKTKSDDINKGNETLKNNIYLLKQEINKLNEELFTLNEKLKTYEKELNEKNNIINDYEIKLKELNQQFKEYKENIIKESNQNKKEIQNSFKNNFEIIKNDIFDLISINKNKIKKNNIIFLIEYFRHEYKNNKNIQKNEENKEKTKEKITTNEIKEIKNKDIILDKKEEKKDITNNMKDKINIFTNNNKNDIIDKKEDNIPNKIFLVSKEKKEETNEEKMKREERMNRALQRIKNKRKIDEEKDKLKKSEKIKQSSIELEAQLKKGEGKKFFVDLEYEKELEEEENN